MDQQSTRLHNAGFATFFFSGICSISIFRFLWPLR